MERQFEGRFDMRLTMQPLHLRIRLVVRALLKICVDEILNRVRKLVPNELAVFARGIFEGGIRCSEISAD